jgi:hypothetical protein
LRRFSSTVLYNRIPIVEGVLDLKSLPQPSQGFRSN